MKTKGKTTRFREHPTMSMKTQSLRDLSDDVHEAKGLNTFLAERASGGEAK
jgi:hypothetical protein